MAEEEHNSRSSNSSSGGGGGGGGGSHRSSKKLKTKKVPQRGMGVAQLEKIISEQRQKKDATIFTDCSSNVRPSPPPPSLPPNHHPWISKADGVNPISASKSTNFGGGGGNWSRLLSDGAYNFQGERQPQIQIQNQNLNLGGLRYESAPPFWPPSPNLMLQRSQHFQQPCSSSMVNVSAGTSMSSSSSALNFQIEPPSNQSYYGNNYHHLQAHEEKMIGMKRPYPFLLESGPIPSFNCKPPSAYVPSISRSDGAASGSNGGTISIEPPHPSFRENQVLTRDFLKLAPPQASQSDSSSKEKLYLSSSIGEQSEFEAPPPQKDQSEDPSHLSGSGGPNRLPFFGFFPAARTPTGQQENSDCEAEESVDLNLKL